MPEVKTYKFPPTRLVPNSPHPLIHYPGFLSAAERTPGRAHDLFNSHGWQTQWVIRYGAMQDAHYHSAAHECMAVLTGTATIRFGVADGEEPNEADSDGDGNGNGSISIRAHPGDVFVLPAGLAHKTFNPSPVAPFRRLTPGDGHSLKDTPEQDEDTTRKMIEVIEPDGFTMIGAYPRGSEWDFAVGGDSEGKFESVWSVPLPGMDPVLGEADEGLRGLWKD